MKLNFDGPLARWMKRRANYSTGRSRYEPRSEAEPRRARRLDAGLCMAITCLLLAGLAPSSAFAVKPAPHLTLTTDAIPTRFSEADTEACLGGLEQSSVTSCDAYQVTVTNSGAQPASGPIVLTDALPIGLHVVAVTFFHAKNQVRLEESERPEGQLLNELCKPEAVPVTCEFPETLLPDQRLEMRIWVTVEPGAASTLNTASVSEGGRPVASRSEDDVISSILPPFGPNAFVSSITATDGTSDTQAGGHPYEFTNRIDLNTRIGFTPVERQFEGTSVQEVRDVVVDLPLGFLGGALATPQKCTFAQLQSFPESCPLDTLVGHLTTEPFTNAAANTPIYNMVPEHGVAAEFGFNDFLFNTHAILASVSPTPAGYVLRATAREVPQVTLANIIATFYGDPASKNGGGATPAPMFTNPSDCSGQPLVTTVHMDSWENLGSLNADGTPNVEGPGSAGWASMKSESPPMTGCNALQFEPEAFSVKPETSAADTPTGLNFELKIPQSETPGTLATPPLRDASVTLPAGLTVNPSAASGLQACSEAQIGWQGGPVTNFTAAAPECPESSKIGSVEVTTPLIAGTLVGSVYLAAQDENPFHSLLAGYIVIDDPATGAIVKIAGQLKTDPNTGQITGVFDENPQLPFSDLKLHFFGGPRGDLATPEGCGTYTTTSDLSPWSAPESGPDATPSDSFEINSGCVSGFAPTFSAGTISNQAGAYSPFTLSFSRNDNEEGLAGLTVALPTGLLGKIAGVAECSDAALAAGAARSGATEQSSPSCPASSQLGAVQTASGPGPSPFAVGGKAYLTGPYKGAPYGVAVIVPALAGPFDLGTVVIRQALYIDPTDAHVTDVSDLFPTILQGIPLRIKRVSVTLDRPEFTFNPTSCEPKTVNATVTSIPGAHAPVSSRFQAAGCASLPFAPKLTASAAGKASKANGTTFIVKVTSAGLGQANIAKVRLQLPKALPSRLTTIQKACRAGVFEANPASCDAGSVIGTATIHTPLLNSPLSGPAYLVSHGGAAFPDVEFVLQGEGVTLVLDGKTDIKKGITYSRFESAPDAPFTKFETVLPAGPHSALTANVPEKEHFSLCKTPLAMPTEIIGQNGTMIKRITKISVTGCKGFKSKATRAQKLAKALKACGKKKNKSKRTACEKQARKKYVAKKAAEKARRRGSERWRRFSSVAADLQAASGVRP